MDKEQKKHIDGIYTKNDYNRHVDNACLIMLSQALANKTVACYTQISVLRSTLASCNPLFSNKDMPESPCYARLPNATMRDEWAPLAYVAGILPECWKIVADHRLIADYFTWLSRESPFKEAIVSFNLQEDSKAGTITVRANCDARVAVGALISARSAHEFPKIVTRWGQFVAAGFTKNMAFLLAHNYDWNKEKGIKRGTSYTGHNVVLADRMNIKQIEAFCKGEPEDKPKYELWEVGASYYGIHDLWGKVGVRGGRKSLGTLYSKVVPKKKPSNTGWGMAEEEPYVPFKTFINALGMDQRLILQKEVRFSSGSNVFQDTTKPVKTLTARTLREHAWKKHLEEWKKNRDTCTCFICVGDERVSWLKENPLSDFQPQQEVIPNTRKQPKPQAKPDFLDMAREARRMYINL